jgi:signal transduction histidine kinase
MTIRVKLITSYTAMLLSVVCIAVASSWTIAKWQSAAEKLTAIRAQSVKAETLRVLMYRQITYALDFLENVPGSVDAFTRLRWEVQSVLEQLKADAASGIETEHQAGLYETHTELVWIGERLIRNVSDSTKRVDPVEARERLREIADEVTDDVTALTQYYQTQVQQRVDEATHLGQAAEGVIVGSVVLALVQLLTIIFLSQRWLVRPIGKVNDAARRISEGNFDVQVAVSGHDEWESLAVTINSMAKSLLQLERRLREQERFAALGEIVAYAAHNLRNPLAGIRAAAQVTRMESETLKPEARESLDDIISTVDRMDLWMRGLLQLATPTPFRPELIDIAALLADTVEMTRKKYAAGGTQLELKVGDDISKAWSDPSLLQQTLAILLNNAFEAESSKIALSASQSGREQLVIEIIDDGKGIPPELQAKLFRAFVTGKKDGIGLGLAQAKKIIDLHGGKISLHSEPGLGTKVTICIPIEGGNRPLTDIEESAK